MFQQAQSLGLLSTPSLDPIQSRSPSELCSVRLAAPPEPQLTESMQVATQNPHQIGGMNVLIFMAAKFE